MINYFTNANHFRSNSVCLHKKTQQAVFSTAITPSLLAYLLLAAACLLAALTNVITEHNFRLHKPTSFLLQLSFRLFYLLGLAAFLSTFIDTPGSPLFVPATLAACLSAFALAWHTASSKPKPLNVAFDSLRLLVDFSSRPFKGRRLRLILFALDQPALGLLRLFLVLQSAGDPRGGPGPDNPVQSSLQTESAHLSVQA